MDWTPPCGHSARSPETTKTYPKAATRSYAVEYSLVGSDGEPEGPPANRRTAAIRDVCAGHHREHRHQGESPSCGLARFWWMAYSGIGKKPDEILKDLEAGTIMEDWKGSTPEYVQAALATSVANAQERWAKVAAVAACISTLVAIAAVTVAALH